MSEPPLTFSQLQKRNIERTEQKDTLDQRDNIVLNAQYIGNNQQIRIFTWNGNASVTLIRMDLRILRRNGVIDTVAISYTPTSNRVAAGTQFNCGTGWILSGIITPLTGSPRRGDTYVLVTIYDTKENKGIQTLCQEYITPATLAMFPFGKTGYQVEGTGKLTSITGTDPAAGAEISEITPTNARWKIRALSASFVADANVANRTIEIVIDDGTNEILRLQDRTVITAGQTRTMQLQTFSALPADTTTTHYFVLPGDFVMLQGYRIRTETTNIQVGDNFGAPTMIIEEWLEE